jgi:hypothetical protein
MRRGGRGSRSREGVPMVICGRSADEYFPCVMACDTQEFKSDSKRGLRTPQDGDTDG